MLSKKDIAVFRGMFQEQEVRIDRKFDERFAQQEVKIDQRFAQQEARFDQKLEDQHMNLEDKLRSCIRASEASLTRKIDGAVAELRFEMHTMRDDILEVIGEEILPQIDEHTREIGLIKHSLKLA